MSSIGGHFPSPSLADHGFASLSGSGLPDGGVHFTYLANSSLIEKSEFKADGSDVLATVEREFEEARDLVASVSNYWGGTEPGDLLSRYAYQNDGLGRRTSAARSGVAFAAAHFDAWSYNARNELTGSDQFLGAPNSPGSAVPANDRAYHYDPIGNRLDSTTGEDDPVYYCSNELNQYDSIDDTNDCPPEAPISEALEYDADGNLVEDGRFRFAWDAENRLVGVEAKSPPSSSDLRLEFDYDYLNRRVEKRVYAWDPNEGLAGDWEETPSLTRRFVWYDWLLLGELNGSNVVLKKYAWGPDLSGTVRDAGGIGGLLGCLDTQGTGTTADDAAYAFFYDANGNVGQLADLSADPNDPAGALAAAYEYDAYGHAIATTGDSADDNPFRFSTKYWDDETGLGYWGERYYEPDWGRWTNHDPIGELGGLNLYAYARNRPNNAIDPRGLRCSSTKCGGTSTTALDPCSATGPAGPLHQRRASRIDDDINKCISEGRKCRFLCTTKTAIEMAACLKGCNDKETDCLRGALPPGGIPPLPADSPECDKYKDDDEYSNAGAKCFCKCAGDSKWSQYVRACLRKMYEAGASPAEAHAACYRLGDADSEDDGRPWGTLTWCHAKCFDYTPID